MVRNRLRSARRSEREEALEDDAAGDVDLLVHFERAERIAAVREAILGLPEHYREVVVLCEIEECSYEEAAVSLDLPVGTVRSRLSRAKQQLKRRLSEYEGSGA
jgi:RNA polymerase sigma-70 factor (ECF subfamily)